MLPWALPEKARAPGRRPGQLWDWCHLPWVTRLSAPHAPSLVWALQAGRFPAGVPSPRCSCDPCGQVAWAKPPSPPLREEGAEHPAEPPWWP